jgi:hypothetical protein
MFRPRPVPSQQYRQSRPIRKPAPNHVAAGLYLVPPSIEGPRTTYFNSFSGKKKTGNSLADNCCLPAYSPAGSPKLPPVNLPFRILEKFLCDLTSIINQQIRPGFPELR